MSFFRSEKLRRVETVFQQENSECGAASLAMILSAFGIRESPERLRVNCGISRNGSKASYIVKAAREYYGLDAKGIRTPVDGLDKVPKPAILFWDFEHFVVYEGKSGKWHYINDPASGEQRLSRDELEKHFTGVVLTFEKGADFSRFAGKGKKRNFRFLKKRGRRKTVSLLTACCAMIAVSGVLLPVATGYLIDEFLKKKRPGTEDVLLWFALLAAFQCLIQGVIALILRREALRFSTNITLRMFGRFFRLPLDFFQQRGSGTLQSVITSAQETAGLFFGYVIPRFLSVVTALFLFLPMLYYSPLLSLIVAAAALLTFVVVRLTEERRHESELRLRNAREQLFGDTMTAISRMEQLRANSGECGIFREWSAKLAECANLEQRLHSSDTFRGAYPVLLLLLCDVALLAVGSRRIVAGALSWGEFAAFLLLSAGFLVPFARFAQSRRSICKLRLAGGKMEDVLLTPVGRNHHGGSALQLPCRAFRGKLELRNLSFGYCRLEPPLIDHLSLTLEPGRRIALVGSSGSGKSTVAKLAAGILTPWSGEVLIDDVPISRLSPEMLRRSLAFINQNIVLFSGSVKDNLTLFRSRTFHMGLHAALHDAGLLEELELRGRALEVEVNEMGVNFSGGQCQKLEIARALVQDTPIMILDEATSALDTLTEQAVDQTLRRRGVSCLFIAHRLSTVRDCDEIIVLDHGKIVERGGHDALMAARGAYAALVEAAPGGVQ